jgi:hypothetical protein
MRRQSHLLVELYAGVDPVGPTYLWCVHCDTPPVLHTLVACHYLATPIIALEITYTKCHATTHPFFSLLTFFLFLAPSMPPVRWIHPS